MKKISNQKIKLFLISGSILLIDQITKILILINLQENIPIKFIPNLINLRLVKNSGAAFSILNNQTSLLGFISFLVSLSLIIFIIKDLNNISLRSLGIAFLLGGSLGNGIDRWDKGFVTDFLDFVPLNFPIFNIADISINIAIFLLLIDYFKAK